MGPSAGSKTESAGEVGQIVEEQKLKGRLVNTLYQPEWWMRASSGPFSTSGMNVNLLLISLKKFRKR